MILLLFLDTQKRCSTVFRDLDTSALVIIHMYTQDGKLFQMQFSTVTQVTCVLLLRSDNTCHNTQFQIYRNKKA